MRGKREGEEESGRGCCQRRAWEPGPGPSPGRRKLFGITHFLPVPCSEGEHTSQGLWGRGPEGLDGCGEPAGPGRGDAPLAWPAGGAHGFEKFHLAWEKKKRKRSYSSSGDLLGVQGEVPECPQGWDTCGVRGWLGESCSPVPGAPGAV